MPDFKAAIFDLDGTLLDSMWVWEKIDVDFLEKRQLSATKTYCSEICAKSFQEAAEYTKILFGLKESAGEIIEEWNRMAIEVYGSEVPLKPYAKKILLYLKERGIQLGIATALPRILYEPVLKNNGIYEMFSVICSTDEVSRGKAFPDVYLLAAEKMEVSPHDCIAFEDVLPGICGIVSAGMRAYGVYDSYSASEKEAIQNMAERYICDFSEMLP